jgi:hypothetical protein
MAMVVVVVPAQQVLSQEQVLPTPVVVAEHLMADQLVQEAQAAAVLVLLVVLLPMEQPTPEVAEEDMVVHQVKPEARVGQVL